MSTFFQVLASLAVLLVPGLTKYVQNLPENTRCFVFGLCMGVVGGWWACHFLADNQSKRDKAEAEKITAETARLAEENAEKKRQWERDRQDRLDAEEKDRLDRKEVEERERKESLKVTYGQYGELISHKDSKTCCPKCSNDKKLQPLASNGVCPICRWSKKFVCQN